MVELKKKVTLKTQTLTTKEDVEKPKVTLKTKKPTPPVPPTPPPGRGKWYAIALVALLALGGGIYYLSQQGNDKTKQEAEVVEPSKPDNNKSDVVNEDKNNPKSSGEKSDNGQNEGQNDDQNVTPVVASEKDTPAKDVQPASSDIKEIVTSPSKSNPDSPSVVQSKQDSASTVNNSKAKEVVTPSNATGSVEEEAIEVIRGKYGNGDVRKRNLGDRYLEIQSKVNEMYRNGLVH